ncbi:unnamed protein product [Caenorhabditis angaria]|uniref:Uncharacterized protein n=1 Tax=Caenorhabditis angaria TaxID=860376 RepID=A0A9P1J4R9_9PELO|nr:unnamed protein product [Caenorhabditis angaria]
MFKLLLFLIISAVFSTAFPTEEENILIGRKFLTAFYKAAKSNDYSIFYFLFVGKGFDQNKNPIGEATKQEIFRLFLSNGRQGNLDVVENNRELVITFLSSTNFRFIFNVNKLNNGFKVTSISYFTSNTTSSQQDNIEIGKRFLEAFQKAAETNDYSMFSMQFKGLRFDVNSNPLGQLSRFDIFPLFLSNHDRGEVEVETINEILLIQYHTTTNVRFVFNVNNLGKNTFILNGVSYYSSNSRNLPTQQENYYIGKQFLQEFQRAAKFNDYSMFSIHFVANRYDLNNNSLGKIPKSEIFRIFLSNYGRGEIDVVEKNGELIIEFRPSSNVRFLFNVVNFGKNGFILKSISYFTPTSLFEDLAAALHREHF